MTDDDPFDRPPDESQRNAATFFALLGLIGISLGLLALTAMVLPRIRGVILVVGALAGIFVLHYLTWGRWLSRRRDEEDEE
jgi:hypothetical protein